MRGKLAYEAGRAAEGCVEQAYLRGGRQIVARRWRGSCGEIDLIAREGDEMIFIEVKKSDTHTHAAEHLLPAQMARLYAAASEFIANEPMGQLTPMRFDVALVDATGRIEIVENAFAG
ncbi:MAG TPA: YraN family protein [Gemmobacter sp.]|nr:YraN family protein [Gemmobacter sp.]